MRIRLTPITWFVVLAVIAVGLALGLPPDPHAVSQLHASQTSYRIAIAVLLIPYVIIWYASFYAFAKLQEYSRPIRHTKDGAAFHILTIGTGTVAFSLVVPTIIAYLLSIITAHYHSFHPAAVIINDYLGLFPGLVAFLLIYNGARMLVSTTDVKTHHPDLRWHAPWFLLLSATFAYLAIQNQYQSNPYHLNNVWILVATYIVPFLYGWMVGLLAADALSVYAKTVKGLLYKRAVKQLANGIAITVWGSIAIQFVNATLAQRINHSLVSVLLADYGLLIIVLVGLVFMALGTKKLKSLEDI
ncbi:MAG TPA: hypothetical protein VGH44_02060 [Candidatus Saccharimonadia bacterium]